MGVTMYKLSNYYESPWPDGMASWGIEEHIDMWCWFNDSYPLLADHWGIEEDIAAGR